MYLGDHDFYHALRFLMELHYVQQPRWGDLDVNQHVNNVKYIGWILEVISSSPTTFHLL